MVTIEQAAASTPRFYLASRSPRRRELLTQAGFAYAELPPGSDPEMRRLSKPFRQSELAEAVARMAAPAPRPLRCE